MEIREDFEVLNRAELVFEALTDVERIGYCIAGVKEVTVTGANESDWLIEVRAGTILRTLELHGRIIESRRPDLIVFDATGQDVELKGSVNLTELEAGKTSCVVQIEAIVTGAFAPLADLMAQGPQRQLIQQTIGNIRSLLDGAEPTQPVGTPFKVSLWSALTSMVHGLGTRIAGWFRGMKSGTEAPREEQDTTTR